MDLDTQREAPAELRQSVQRRPRLAADLLAPRADALAERLVNAVTRECLALVVHTSQSRQRVNRELVRLTALRGHPRMIVGGTGRERTATAILQRQARSGLLWQFNSKSTSIPVPSFSLDRPYHGLQGREEFWP